MAKLNIQQFRDEITRMDQNCEPGSMPWKAALLILVSLQEGGDKKHLARFCSLPIEDIEALVGNLRQSKAWGDGGIITAGDYSHPEEGGVAFWMDVAVACGWLERAGAPKTRRPKEAA